MKVCCLGHTCDYEAGNMARMYFDEVTLSWEEPENGEDAVCTYLTDEGDAYSAKATVYLDDTITEKTVREKKNEDTAERIIGKAMYKALSEATGIYPPWGILTGIRPVKLVRQKGREARRFLTEKSLVSPQKTKLALDTAQKESKILALSQNNSFSLYIGIPFCPSRCSYCSFVSKTVEQAGRLMDDYVEKLVKDIAFTAEISHQIGLRLETVYFGGGTPTTLSAEQMRRVMAAVSQHFVLSSLREYTVEGGRPETLSEEKLAVLIEGGCDRLSINPQTMQDTVLNAAGRKHTVEDVYKAYDLAKRYPFRTVNMDLIAGLPLDTPDGFSFSVDSVLALNPQNITVHTLCIKRAAYLKQGRPPLPSDGEVTAMLSYGQTVLEKAGYLPYYLYRQRNTLANAENVGWAKEGHECLYNVYIMDQTHTILSCGAGGVNILRQPGGDRIERVFHYKYPYEYISRFDGLMDKKREILSFYERYPLSL